MIELVEHQAMVSLWHDADVPEARQSELVEDAKRRLGYLVPADFMLAGFDFVALTTQACVPAGTVERPRGAKVTARIIALPLVPSPFEVIGVVLFELVGDDPADDDLICAAAIVNHLAVALDAFRSRSRVAALADQLKAAQKARAVATLVGGVAHHFNNQLTVILANIALMHEDAGGGPFDSQALSEIQEAGNRVVALTRQMLAIGRKQRATRRRVDINALVTAMTPHLSEIVEGPTGGLELSLSHDLWLVEADPRQLEVVITAIVLNAHEAGGAHPSIRVSARNETAGGDGMPGEFVAISVKDHGHGMDRATQARMFEPFFSTKDPGLVAGLGLAEADGIVAMSGGHIGVETGVGRGTTVTVFLPAVAPPDQARKSILVASADAATHARIAETSPIKNHAVLPTRTWDETLKACSQFNGPIDLLVLDAEASLIPGDVFGAIHRLRLLRPGAAVVVLLPRQIRLPAGRAARGLVALAKPFTPADLSRAVLAATSSVRPAVAAKTEPERRSAPGERPGE